MTAKQTTWLILWLFVSARKDFLFVPFPMPIIFPVWPTSCPPLQLSPSSFCSDLLRMVTSCPFPMAIPLFLLQCVEYQTNGEYRDMSKWIPNLKSFEAVEYQDSYSNFCKYSICSLQYNSCTKVHDNTQFPLWRIFILGKTFGGTKYGKRNNIYYKPRLHIYFIFKMSWLDEIFTQLCAF